MADIGYTKPLFILPFDHRSSFVKGLFGIEGRDANEEEAGKVRDAKRIVYDAALKAIENGIKKEYVAILVDEQFGTDILKDAKQEGVTTLLTTEKSGQDEFDFEYGQDFGKHLEEFKPTFAKALIRYNPQGDHELNARQTERLKTLSDFVHSHEMKLLIEPLIPPTESQLASVDGDTARFDRELRPNLTVEMMDQLQRGGVAVDVWKIEGMETSSNYLRVSEQAHYDGNNAVGIVILGRAASRKDVHKWLTAGLGIPGVIGFAVGRTIFWEPLEKWRDGTYTREQAVDAISSHYQEYCQLFLETLKQ